MNVLLGWGLGRSKHAAALLLGLHDHSCGKMMTLEESCTSKLQTFHRPSKVYSGSPVKCEDFPVPRKMNQLIFDPEPMDFKQSPEAYKAMVNNLAINYAANKNKNIPLLQQIQPANIYASVSDHQYSRRNVERHILRHLNVANISSDEIKNVERLTQGQNKTKRWAKERVKRLQSSQFHRVIRRSTADGHKLARSLMTVKNIRCAAINHGRKYEKVAIEKFMDKYKIHVQESGIVVSKQRPYLGCSPDGITGTGNLVEVKCPYTARNSKINVVSVKFLKMKNGKLSLDKNHEYYSQVQGQIALAREYVISLCIHSKIS